MGCDDSDVPGHAPRYLDVGHNISMISRIVYVIICVLALVGLGFGIKHYRSTKIDTEVLNLIKAKHPDWQTIEPIRETSGLGGFSMNGKTVSYVIQFKTKTTTDNWYYVEEDRKWVKIEFPSGAFVDP